MVETARRPERTWLRPRRMLAVAALCLLLAIGLLTAGWFPQERVRVLVERRMREAIGPHSRIGALHVVPGSLSAELRELTLEGPSYRIEVPRARVKATMALVLRGTLDLSSLEAEAPRITLWPSPEGAPPSERPDVRIGSLRVTDGTIVYVDERLGGTLRLDDVDAGGSIGEGTLVATAGGGLLSRDPEVPLGPAALRAHVSRSFDVDVQAMEAGTARSRVRGSGRIQTADPGALDLRWDATADLEELARFAPRPLVAAGVVQAGGTVIGTMDVPAVSGTATGERLLVRDVHIERADLRFAYEPSGSHASFSAQALGGTITGDARLQGERVTAHARAAGVETRRLPASAAPQGLPPSRVSGRLSAEGPLEGPLQVAFDLNGAGAQAGVRHEVSAQGGGRVDAGGPRVDLDWRAQVALSNALAAGATGWRSARLRAEGDARGALPPDVAGTLAGTVAVQTATGPQDVAVDGRVTSRGSRVDATLTANGLGGSGRVLFGGDGRVVRDLRVEARGIDVSPFAAGATGRVDVDAHASGPLDRLSGAGTLRASDVAWRGVDVGAASVDLSGAAGRGRARLAVPSMNVGGEATLDAEGLSGRFELAQTPLAPLAPLMPGGRPLEGAVTATLDVRMPWRAPERAAMDAHVASAEVVSGDLGAVATRPFTVAWSDRRARLEGLEAEGEGLHVKASGSAGLRPGDAVEGRVQVDADLAALGAPAPWGVSGTFSADATLSGTRATPRLAGSAEAADVLVTGAGDTPVMAARSARLELQGDRIVLTSLEADVAGGTLIATGEAPLAAVWPAQAPASSELVRVEAEIADVDAGVLAAALRDARVPVDGTLSARLTLEGRPAAGELRGSLEASPTTLRVDDVAVELGALRARADGASIVLEPWSVRSHGGEVVTRGSADLETRALEGTSRGRLDLRALSPLVEQGVLAGDAELDVSVAGSLDAPQARGGVTLADASLRLREIPQAITGIRGRAVLEGRLVRLEDVQAEWGGGTLAMSGTAGLAADAPVDLKLEARDVSLRYPRDFRSRLRADLTLGGRRDSLLLAGEVHAERGLYDTDIHLEETLLAPRVPSPAATSSPLLESIGLDLAVVTDRPVIVRNNLAELEASGRLRIRGDARYPAPFGRLDVRNGGRVFLQTRVFTIRNGSLTYSGSLDPEIAITAETVIPQVEDEDVRVTVVASGPLERPVLDLRSDPSYTEREIASLIATGRRGVLDSPTGAAWAAGEHTAVLLAGRFTRGLSRSLRDLGLDEVDIQPRLLAREADPGARFTFGKMLSPRLKLVYSVGLNDPEARFFQAQYRFRVGREVTAKLQYDDDGAYTYGVGQRWRWGGDRTRAGGGRGGRRRLADDSVALTEVRLEGVPAELEAAVRRRLRVEAGSRTDFWRLQDEAESVQDLLHSAGYLEALASADLEGTVGVVEARPGPRYAWMVEGLPAAPDLTEDMRRAFFEEEAIEAGRRRLLEEAHRRGYVKAQVDAEVRGDQSARTIVFEVTPGEPAVVRAVTFTGASALSSRSLLAAAGGETALLNEPLAARDRIVAFYREKHFLAATVGLPRVQESEDRASITIDVAIDEGAEALLAEVRFEGNSRDEVELADAARIETGNPYDPVPVEDAVQRIRAYYLERGYASVRVAPRLEPRGTDLDLVLRIVEGQQQFVGDVVFQGLRRTKEATVRRVLPFKKGDPLDPRALTMLERRLLDLDVFRRAAATASQDEHATITVEVREQGPYTLQYDVRHNRDEGFSGTLDGEVGNIAGTALALGARVRGGADIREVRGSLHLPALGKAAEVTGTVFWNEEDFLLVQEQGTRPSFAPLADTERQQGFEIQHARAAPLKWDFLLGYRLKRIGSVQRDFRQDLSSIQASAVRESRDSTLDPREGMFLSLSLEYGPEVIGSDFEFFKATAQAFLARPLGDSLTWAQGYRIGLANGLDEQIRFQTLLFGRSTEGFRLGGANSIRGFAIDSVGPPGPIEGLSRGGEAMLLMNQELRYRHPTGLGLAVFYDVGNAYPELKDFRRFELLHALGGGIRYDSPVGLLRLDVGFPLNKRPGDRSYQWFFSLGQAF